MRKSKQKYKHRVEQLHTVWEAQPAKTMSVWFNRQKQSCYNFVMRLDNNDRGAVRENSAPAESTGVANEKHSGNSGINPFSRQQVTNTNSHWRTQKWQQEIPARGRGRRVKRGGGLASATWEEIEELKRQETSGIIPTSQALLFRYRRFSVDRQALVPLRVGSFAGYWLYYSIFVCSHHLIYCL